MQIIMNKLTKLLLFLLVVEIFGKFEENDKSVALDLVSEDEGRALKHSEEQTKIHKGNHVADAQSAVTTTPEAPVKTAKKVCQNHTIKEPDQHDVTKFTETDQEICPQNIHQVPVVTIHQPQAPASSIHMIQIPINIQPLPQEPNSGVASSTTLSPGTAGMQPNASTVAPQDRYHNKNAGKTFRPTNCSSLLLLAALLIGRLC